MNSPIDLMGQRFGRLVAIQRTKIGRLSAYICRCDCGNERTIVLTSLTGGVTKSCGCIRREMMRDKQMKHGRYGSPTYLSYRSMLARCFDENLKAFLLYGGRGITVCDRWKEGFENFLNDMGERPEGTSLDRIDNDRNYEPENCRWATRIEQANNKRNVRLLTLNGETHTITEWAQILGTTRATIKNRLKRGKSVEQSLAI